MKRVLSAAAALTLTLSLGASALAYSGTITLNGTKLDTAKLPDAPAGSVIPLRAVAEAGGVSIGRIQHYFPSKAALIREGCAQMVAAAEGKYREQAATAPPGAFLPEFFCVPPAVPHPTSPTPPRTAARSQ